MKLPQQSLNGEDWGINAAAPNAARERKYLFLDTMMAGCEPNEIALQSGSSPGAAPVEHVLNLPFNLNLLRSLDVLLETRNLTAAARLLGLTQSAMSRQLALLRSELNDPLLIRDGQRYLPSQRAIALQEPLKRALAAMESVLDAPQFDPALCTRQFVLCGSDYIADNMLPELVRKIGPMAPRLRLAFRMSEPGNYRSLSDEGVDLLPAIADMVPDNLHGRSMGEDRSVCLMRAGHPLACETLTLEHYIDWPHARIAGGSDKDSFVELYLAKLGLQRNVALTAPFFAAVLRIVLDNDLLLTIPEHIAVKLAQRAPIVHKALPFDAPLHRYWLLWHARCHYDPAHKWFRDQVFDVMYHSMHGVTQFNLAE
jgi:DNA-binding transcriptional LysR family regulator